jgi:CheY-like chemotaxis protein
MRYLEGEDTYADRSKFPTPTLLVLDIKLPGMDGFELLAWLRADPRFSALPVVLNSSSDKPQDVQRAAKLGATKFLVKTPNYQSLVKLVKEFPAIKPANCLWALAPIQQREVWKAAVMRDYLGK